MIALCAGLREQRLVLPGTNTLERLALKGQAAARRQAAACISFLSGRYDSFHSSVIGATAGEAPFVLDGLVGNPMLLDLLVHYTDTGGVLDHVFALFHLLGIKSEPRLCDFPDRKLACFGSPSQWPFLASLIGSPIKGGVILQHWGDTIRLAGSAKTKAIKPSATLRKLGG